MTTPGPDQNDQAPPPGDPQPHRDGAPQARRGPTLLVGLVAGLAVGAGGLGAAWVYSAGSADPDVEIVCTTAEQTPAPIVDPYRMPSGDDLVHYTRWLGLTTFGAWLADDDPAHQQLADALADVDAAVAHGNNAELAVATERTKQICADL